MIRSERILQDIQALHQFNQTPGNGCTRYSFSKEDRQARNYIEMEMEKIGLPVLTDAYGNVLIFGQGKSDRHVIIGSHIDTVPNGGDYDGILGVVSGLEILRHFHEEKIVPEVGLVVVAFAEEEGNQFGMPCVGCHSMVNLKREEALNRVRDDGKTYQELMEPFIRDDERGSMDFSKILAMLEIHVEQGPVLWREDLEVGIVEGIFGLQRYMILVEGVSNHSGATPMTERQDSMVAAASMIQRVRLRGREAMPQVATVGRIHCHPNTVNIIPDSVEFSVEVRDFDKKQIDESYELLWKDFDRIAETEGVTWSKRPVGTSPVIHLDSDLIGQMDQIAEKLGVKAKRIVSGAAHDAAIVAAFIPTEMLFVQSVEGRSHCPEEYTPIEKIVPAVRMAEQWVREMKSK
ncbi:Zn-dependent hydrolase [Gottschalkiaceae bacterium SANA]|nr:Zn-dependent hydrolase [Gottschalkiaceae bacterium SANA]